MLTSHTLYLGSKSESRHSLLKSSRIPFVQITQNADEIVPPEHATLQQKVLAITLQKMEHAIIPVDATKNTHIFVLTADTLVQNAAGRICGKPNGYDDAVSMIQSARSGMVVSTAFCLEKRIYNGATWLALDHTTQVVSAHYTIDMPDHCIAQYLALCPHSMHCAGAVAGEALGAQFVKNVSGSYSAILGLPLFELRQALEAMGFFDRAQVSLQSQAADLTSLSNQ